MAHGVKAFEKSLSAQVRCGEAGAPVHVGQETKFRWRFTSRVRGPLQDRLFTAERRALEFA